jgi:hypothetical protein
MTEGLLAVAAVVALSMTVLFVPTVLDDTVLELLDTVFELLDTVLEDELTVLLIVELEIVSVAKAEGI